MSEDLLIETAEFTKKIKTYVLLQVAFFLLVSFIGIPLLPLWLLGIGQWYGRKYYRSLECDLTNKHLRFKKGVLFRVEKTIPLENIQNLTFIENPLLRWLELRVLKIETAGQSNPHGSDMKLIGIIDPGQFKDHVLQQRTIKIGASDHHQAVTGDDQVLTELKAIRSLLDDIKKNTTPS